MGSPPSTKASWVIVVCGCLSPVSTFVGIGVCCRCSSASSRCMLVLLSIDRVRTPATTSHTSQCRVSWTKRVLRTASCVALVSFNLQGIPRRPVMNPFRPGPDEMALDSLFQTPSTFDSSNPSAQPVVPRPKRQTYADLAFLSRLVTSLICRSVSGVSFSSSSGPRVVGESYWGAATA